MVRKIYGGREMSGILAIIFMLVGLFMIVAFIFVVVTMLIVGRRFMDMALGKDTYYSGHKRKGR